MASSELDPKSGYNSTTRTYHSLRPSVPIPPATAPLSTADAITSFLRSSATAPLASIPAFIDSGTGETLSYSQFLRQVRSLAAVLRRGTANFPPIRKGDVALILSPNTLKVPVLHFSLLSIGAVVSPANPLLSDSELDHVVRLVNPAVAFAVSSSSRRLSSLPTLILDSPEFDSLLTEHDSHRVDSDDGISQSDVAAILFSSGTTGKIKGVQLTHRNLTALVTCLHYTAGGDKKNEGRPVLLFTLPLFHVFGFFMMLRSVATAETAVLLARFTLEGMLSTVERFKVTYIPVSPPLVVLLAKSEITDRYDLRSLETVGSGGAPLSEEIARRFKDKFPWIDCVQGYGLTETCGVVSRALPEEADRYASVGRLSELIEAKIVDPSSGDALPPGQRGELWLRGPTIMKGYVGDEESTRATFSEEWLKTGDVCYFDDEGFLYIVDRLKELIKYKGYQVPPVELENVLLSHPEVADAAVIPYPDEEAGQVPMAFVVRQPKSAVSGGEIMGFVAKQVAPYKKVRRVAFISAIPRSPQGKILRRELVNQALSASASASSRL